MQAESGAAAAANGAAGCGGSSPRCLPSWCCLGRGGFDQSPLLFPVLRRLLSACREHTHGRERREPRGDAPKVDVNSTSLYKRYLKNELKST